MQHKSSCSLLPCCHLDLEKSGHHHQLPLKILFNNSIYTGISRIKTKQLRTATREQKIGRVVYHNCRGAFVRGT